MSILFILATLFGILSGCANFIQAFKIFKRKSAKDISIIAYSIFTVGGVIWVLYGIEISNLPVIITNSIGLLGVSFVVIGWFLYGR